MKRRFSALLLALALTLGMAAPALAYGDVTFTKDTTLTSLVNRYDNVTVKAGVTVTMKEFKPDPQGLEIYKSLTVEAGGKIVGPGSIMLCGEGVTYSGMDLYYRVKGQEKRLDPANLAALIAEDENHWSVFSWVAETGHYVLNGEGFEADPFETPPPGDGGQNGETPPDPNAQASLDAALALKSLGLFKGTVDDAVTAEDFALSRAPTRLEAVIITVRLLGKDAEALSRTWEQPFVDVPTWTGAENYVGYAYTHEITNGVDDGKVSGTPRFGSDETALVNQFLTFVLRAMGYADESRNGTDFSWRAPETLAVELGLLHSTHDVDTFDRGACARVMRNALRCNTKDGTPLWEKLAADGVFTAEAYHAAMDGV